MVGSKVFLVGTCVWAASLPVSAGCFALFIGTALGAVAWVGRDLLGTARSRRALDQFDDEIAELLASPEDGGPYRR